MVRQRIKIRKYIDKVTQKYIFFIDRQSETIVCYGDIEKKGIKFISIWSSIFIYSQRRLYSPILVPDHRGLYFYLLFCIDIQIMRVTSKLKSKAYQTGSRSLYSALRSSYKTFLGPTGIFPQNFSTISSTVLIEKNKKD